MNSFWKNKTVFVTGHTGFKGSWLCLWLELLEAKVIGYALPPPTHPSLFEVAHVSKGMHSITGDVCDLKSLSAAIQDSQPDVIFHLAAQSLVRSSYQDPVQTYATNLMGTVHILEAARHLKKPRVIINVTSDKCYENQEWIWGYRETDPMGGYDPYSSSKGCAELITSAYRNSFFHPEKYSFHQTGLASARAGNVIGGGDWANDRLIPDWVRAFLKNEKLILRNPQSTRPWQHVLEPLSGYLLLAEKLWENPSQYASAWNFGPRFEDTQSVGWIINELNQLSGEKTDWVQDVAQHPHEANLLRLDCSKVNAYLGWVPKLNLKTTLAWTARWYQDYHNRLDMKKICQDQIQTYIDFKL